MMRCRDGHDSLLGGRQVRLIREWCWIGALCVGCGGNPAAPSPESKPSAPVAATEEQIPDRDAPAPARRPILQAPAPQFDAAPKPPGFSSEKTDATSVAETPEVDPARMQAARRAFETLINPGATAEQWDAAHLAIVELGEDALPVVRDELRAGESLRREMAVTVVMLMGDTGAGVADDLLNCLSDASPFVQANAAVALAQVRAHTPQAISTLVGFLESPDPQLRRLAALNLDSFGDEASTHLPALTRALEVSHPPEVLVPVVQLLGRLGPHAQSAVPKLQRIAFEQPGPVGAAAHEALSRIVTANRAVPSGGPTLSPPSE